MGKKPICDKCVRAAYARKWRQGNQQRARQLVTDYQARNPEMVFKNNRAQGLRRYYGMTVADYDSLLLKQDGRCAICLTDKPSGKNGRLVVDHCHTTGNIRGLLCMKCNFMIGYASENSDTLKQGAAYIERVNGCVL